VTGNTLAGKPLNGKRRDCSRRSSFRVFASTEGVAGLWSVPIPLSALGAADAGADVFIARDPTLQLAGLEQIGGDRVAHRREPFSELGAGDRPEIGHFGHDYGDISGKNGGSSLSG
jgi:hypothetical protein